MTINLRPIDIHLEGETRVVRNCDIRISVEEKLELAIFIEEERDKKSVCMVHLDSDQVLFLIDSLKIFLPDLKEREKAQRNFSFLMDYAKNKNMNFQELEDEVKLEKLIRNKPFNY